MGTHPIFESDFDCLTEMNSDLAPAESVMSDENLNKNGKEQTNENSVLEKTQAEAMETDQVGHGQEKGHFTSEIFKIELGPIPKMIGYGEVKNFLLKRHKIRAHKIKYIKQYKKCYVCFKNEKDRNHALETLNGLKLKKEVLVAKLADPAKDTMASNRNEPSEPEAPDLRTTTEKILDAVCPWRRFDYPKQLADKTDKAKFNCVKINNLLRQATSFAQSNVTWPKDSYNTDTKLSFRFLSCVGAEVIWDYRNKCELTFGYDGEGKRSAGFRIGKYKDKTIQVESARDVPLNMPPIQRALGEIEDFIAKSAFEPYSPATYEGHWTIVTMRCGGSDRGAVVDGRVAPPAEASNLVATFVFTRNSL